MPDGCNPLRENGACLLPFPSSAFLVADATTTTGFHVNLTPDLMPVSSQGTKFTPTRWNMVDGFSPSAEILVYFPERIDGTTLPPIGETGRA